MTVLGHAWSFARRHWRWLLGLIVGLVLFTAGRASVGRTVTTETESTKSTTATATTTSTSTEVGHTAAVKTTEEVKRVVVYRDRFIAVDGSVRESEIEVEDTTTRGAEAITALHQAEATRTATSAATTAESTHTKTTSGDGVNAWRITALASIDLQLEPRVGIAIQRGFALPLQLGTGAIGVFGLTKTSVLTAPMIGVAITLDF